MMLPECKGVSQMKNDIKDLLIMTSGVALGVILAKLVAKMFPSL